MARVEMAATTVPTTSLAKSRTGEATRMTGSSSPSASSCESVPSSTVPGSSARALSITRSVERPAALRGEGHAAPLALRPGPHARQQRPLQPGQGHRGDRAALVLDEPAQEVLGELGVARVEGELHGLGLGPGPHGEGALPLEAQHRLVDLAGAGLQVVLHRRLDHAAGHPLEAEGRHHQRAGDQGQRGRQQPQPERVGDPLEHYLAPCVVE